MRQRNGTARPYHSGLEPDTIIDTAVELTADSGLWSWSLRDLASALEVAPSVIYHHVGGRDLLCRSVVERVVQTIPLPPPNTVWREWFSTYLYAARPVLARYPGVAKWMVLHGPGYRSAIPVVDAGVETLQRAGFGSDTAYVYASLFNTAMMTITIGDERRKHEDDGSRDHLAMMAEFDELKHDSPGLTVLSNDIVAPLTLGPEAGERATERYFRLTLEALMDGLEARLQRARGRTENP